MLPVIAIYVSGVCWVGVYVLIAKRGFQDKSYGMPLPALSANIAWETVFSLIYLFGGKSPAEVIIYVWLILDIFILATFFLYGYNCFGKQYGLTRPQFYAVGIFALLTAYGFFLTAPPFLLSLPLFKGSMFQVASFLAYLLNLAISVLFVNMLWLRKSVEGQSLYIGLLKWLGTLVVAVPYFLDHNYPFVWFIVAEIEIFDILYLKMIHGMLRQNGINPWLRI